MPNRLANPIRGTRNRRTGFDSYLKNVQKAGCSLVPRYDEARQDFNRRLRREVRGYLG